MNHHHSSSVGVIGGGGNGKDYRGDEEEEKEERKTKKSVLVVKDEDNDCFYESLDRILSSSNSSTSTSASDDDDDALLNTSTSFSSPNHRLHWGRPPMTHADYVAFPVPEIPVLKEKYGAWITDSFSYSIEQRRDRLLRALGLAEDTSLHRQKRPGGGDGGGRRCDFYRSVLADQFSGTGASSVERNSGGLGIVRSRSEGSTDFKSSNDHHHQCNCNNEGNGGGGDFSCDGSFPGFNKPRTRKMNEIRTDSAAIPSQVSRGDGSVDAAGNVEDNGLGGNADFQMCTIKNLDNGKEFVVNEVREDGTWNKLREVATGRQLTMEEFEMCVGHSPIVQELMRRQNVEERGKDNLVLDANGNVDNCSRMRKNVGWLKSVKSVARTVRGHKERRSSEEKDTLSERGVPRLSSATDDSQDVSFHGPEKVRVRQYGKSVKEMSALYKSQEIQAHNGSIWTIKFSMDGRFLASAGEDCVIHVWQVVESERKGDLLIDRLDDGSLNLLLMTNGSPEPSSLSPNMDSPVERKRRGRASIGRKLPNGDHVVVPETIFALSEKPFCSFLGHLDDVLDLSWSKSRLLLSSSMDKTVRLWNLSCKTCLKVFSHNDYVTCIQFNPVDDRYFISGSLDAKVRIWSIPDHQVVDWNDLHEMVTAACYTPDGQGALVGSYKGSCRLFNTSDNKLQQKGQINLQNKKKKSHLKKITGYHFLPGSSSEVLITSADSQIRLIDSVELVHKFKGLHNTNSQISAAISANGKYVVSASEYSHVYVWKHEGDSRPSRGKGVTVTRSYEHFHCQDVYVAIPWPGITDSYGMHSPFSKEQNGTCRHYDEILSANHPPTPVEEFNDKVGFPSVSGCGHSPLQGTISSDTQSYFFDRIAATWPEDKIHFATMNRSPCASFDSSGDLVQSRSAWGMVIVTAGLRGEIRTFQNFGLPVRI